MTLIGALCLLLLGVAIGGPVRRFLARLRAGEWRPGAGTLGVAALVAGLFLAVRGDGPLGLGLGAVGILALLWTRHSAGLGVTFGKWASRPGASASARDPMSRQAAADILGVAVDADPATVQAAYLKQIRKAHPDAGGTPGLAAQLNRAREVLGGR